MFIILYIILQCFMLSRWLVINEWITHYTGLGICLRLLTHQNNYYKIDNILWATVNGLAVRQPLVVFCLLSTLTSSLSSLLVLLLLVLLVLLVLVLLVLVVLLLLLLLFLNNYSIYKNWNIFYFDE